MKAADTEALCTGRLDCGLLGFSKRGSPLELAQRERIPLATLDVKLVAAATAESAPLIGS